MNHTYLLKHHQLKATPQRIAIIEFMDQAGHITIDELYQAVRHKFTSISLATLYKNIHTMLEVSLIREVKIAGQKTKYEIEKESHAHLVCKECGALHDIDFDPSPILADVVHTTRYQPDEISVVISGICPECTQNKTKM
jgi:Fur family transcriptional regulator, peroxide stress response regulator